MSELDGVASIAEVGAETQTTVVINTEEEVDDSSSISSEDTTLLFTGDEESDLKQTQGTQTDDLLPLPHHHLTGIIPQHILSNIKEDAPWVLTMLNNVDDRFHDLASKINSASCKTEEVNEKVDSDHQYHHRNCLLIHNLADMPAYNKNGEAFSWYI